MRYQRSRAVPRFAPVRGRVFIPSALASIAVLPLGLAGCGSSSPSKSYQQGWDRAVTEPGYACKTIPPNIASGSEWAKGCTTGQGFLNAHETTGHDPSPTPTTYPGDP